MRPPGAHPHPECSPPALPRAPHALQHLHCHPGQKMTTAGFEPAPFRTAALDHPHSALDHSATWSPALTVPRLRGAAGSAGARTDERTRISGARQARGATSAMPGPHTSLLKLDVSGKPCAYHGMHAIAPAGRCPVPPPPSLLGALPSIPSPCCLSSDRNFDVGMPFEPAQRLALLRWLPFLASRHQTGACV